jgi:hypothetical protein
MRAIDCRNDLEKTSHRGSHRGGASEGATDRTFGRTQPRRENLFDGQDFVRDFNDAIGALPKRASPKQVLNMDDTGVTDQAFKGKNYRVASLMNCRADPHPQEAGEIIYLSLAGNRIAWPEFPSSLVSDAKFKDAELRQLQDESHTFRTPGGCITTSALAFQIQYVITT